MALKTAGTEMWVILTNSNGPEAIKIGCPTGVTGLGGSKTQLDATCLDSEEMEYEAGMANPGQVTVNLNFDPQAPSHLELWDLFESGDTVTWVIGFRGSTAPPTVDTAGVVTYPGGRRYISFDGYVADLPLDFAVNALVKSTMQVQRSGPRTRHNW